MLLLSPIERRLRHIVPRAHRVHRSAALGLAKDVDDLPFAESTFSLVLLLTVFAAQLQKCHVQLFGARPSSSVLKDFSWNPKINQP